MQHLILCKNSLQSLHNWWTIPLRRDHRNLWHLRHWLQYWQLRTWIHDNLCYLTINCDTGQHSQFLRCFWIQCELPVRNHDTSSPKNIHELTFSDMWRLLRRQMFHTCWGEFIYLGLFKNVWILLLTHIFVRLWRWRIWQRRAYWSR